MSPLEKFLIFLNTCMMIMAIVMVGVSSAAIYDYDESEDNLYPKDTHVYFIVAGILGILLSAYACSGIRNQQQHYNRVFVYFIGLSILFILSVLGFYGYITFMTAIESTSGQVEVTEGSISETVQREVTEEISDYILSTYTTCCSGCDESEENITDCKELIEPFREEETNAIFCENCTQAQLCGPNGALGQGCYINAKLIPSYTIRKSQCNYLTTTDPVLVGFKSKGHCGGGNPKKFVDNVRNWLTENKNASIAAFSLITVVVGLSWLGTFKILLCPSAQNTGAAEDKVIAI